MIRRVIGDTSAIVAVLRRDDEHHEWATKKILDLPKPLFTCETVLAEACFLLGNFHGGPAAVVGRVSEGIIRIDFSLEPQIDRVAELLRKYADVPMSLADACLVRMAELLDDSAVFTLDSDFLIYRKHRNQRIPVVTPR